VFLPVVPRCAAEIDSWSIDRKDAVVCSKDRYSLNHWRSAGAFLEML